MRHEGWGRTIPLNGGFDLIQATAWAVEFIAEQLIRRTGGVAKTTMHAAAQIFQEPSTGVLRLNGRI